MMDDVMQQEPVQRERLSNLETLATDLEEFQREVYEIYRWFPSSENVSPEDRECVRFNVREYRDFKLRVDNFRT